MDRGRAQALPARLAEARQGARRKRDSPPCSTRRDLPFYSARRRAPAPRRTAPRPRARRRRIARDSTADTPRPRPEGGHGLARGPSAPPFPGTWHRAACSLRRVSRFPPARHIARREIATTTRFKREAKKRFARRRDPLTRAPPRPPSSSLQGDWRGISRHFVQSRTPTQVASHAQKYFIRQNNMNKRKRRSSLFDIVNEPAPEDAAAQDPTRRGLRPAGAGGLSMAMATAGAGYNPTECLPGDVQLARSRAPALAGAAAPPARRRRAGEAAAHDRVAVHGGEPRGDGGYQAAAAGSGRPRPPRVAAHVPVPAPSAPRRSPGRRRRRRSRRSTPPRDSRR